MKKLILTISLVVAASATVMAQGNFVFSTTARYVWDNWSSAAIKGDASNNVAFLIGTGTPLVDSIATSVATNVGVGNLPGQSIATAWTDILTDPNFHLATNSGTGNLVVQQTSGTGAISYLSGGTFGVTGTSSSGGSINVYVIGWSSAYADPFTAAAAGSVVGWSSVFSYAYGSSIGTPSTMGLGGLVPFGVSGVVATPEPSTMALAALGGASLLLFRRRK